MKRRKKLNRKKAARAFQRGNKVHRKNVSGSVMRGGIRL